MKSRLLTFIARPETAVRFHILTILDLKRSGRTSLKKCRFPTNFSYVHESWTPIDSLPDGIR